MGNEKEKKKKRKKMMKKKKKKKKECEWVGGMEGRREKGEGRREKGGRGGWQEKQSVTKCE